MIAADLHLRLFAGVLGLAFFTSLLIVKILLLRLLKFLPRWTRLPAWATLGFSLVFPFRFSVNRSSVETYALLVSSFRSASPPTASASLETTFRAFSSIIAPTSR